MGLGRLKGEGGAELVRTRLAILDLALGGFEKGRGDTDLVRTKLAILDLALRAS